MSETFTLLPHEYPDTSQMILEDDEPLNSFINEKQQRLLTTVFYSGADTGINVPFIAACRFIRPRSSFWHRSRCVFKLKYCCGRTMVGTKRAFLFILGIWQAARCGN